MLRVLDAVKIEACGANHGKRGVHGKNLASAQTALQRAFSMQHKTSAQADPMEVCDNFGTMVKECSKRSHDQAFEASLQLAFKCTTEALQGDFKRFKTVSAMLALVHTFKQQTSSARNESATPAQAATPGTVPRSNGGAGQ